MTAPGAPPAGGGGWSPAQRARWAAVADCDQAAALAEEAGYPGQATALRDLGKRMSAPSRPSLPVVMFVGEPSVGKSSLINAVLGQHGLSPVGAGITTLVPVVFAQGPAFAARAAGTARRPAMVSLTPPDLAGVVTGETPVTSDGEQLAVSSVEIDLPNPALAGLRILDTPGVLGVGAQHKSITNILLAGADALVLIVKATAPLSQAEADLAIRAATGAVAVIVVASHADAVPDPERAVQDLSARLGDASPLLAGVPVLATSATMAELAASLTGEDARIADAVTGIAPLLGQVQAAVSGCADLRTTRSVLSALAGRCGQLSAALSARLAAAAANDETSALDAAKLQVNALVKIVSREARIAAQTATQDALAEFRLGADDFSSVARRLRNEYLNRAYSGAAIDLPGLPEQLRGELAEAATSILTSKIRLGEQVAVAVADAFTADDPAAGVPADFPAEISRRLTARLPAPDPGGLAAPEIIVRDQGLDDASRAQAVASNAIFTSMLAGSAGSLLSGNPISLVLSGISVGAGLLRNRSTKEAATRQSERAHRAAVAAAISTGIGDAIAEFNSTWARIAREVSTGLRAAVDEIFEEQLDALSMARSDVQRLQDKGSATQEQRRRLGQVRDELAKRADKAGAQLRGLRLPGGGVAR